MYDRLSINLELYELKISEQFDTATVHGLL